MIRKYAPHAHDALERAQDWIGRPYPRGWCLRWVAQEIYRVPVDWDATTWWTKSAAQGSVVRLGPDVLEALADDLPAGVPILWTSFQLSPQAQALGPGPGVPGRVGPGVVGDGPGHVAITSGRGRCITTDAPRLGVVGEVAIRDVAQFWPRLELAGLVFQDPAGFLLTRPLAVSPSLPGVPQ